MKNLPQTTDKTKQKLLTNLPAHATSLKATKQNLITATVMPIIFCVLTFIGVSLVIIETLSLNDILTALTYSCPIALVFLIACLSGRRKNIKILDDIIGKCTDNELNYRQFRALLKQDLKLKHQIRILINALDEKDEAKGTVYNVTIVEVPKDKKLDVFQALTNFGCSSSVANHACETPSTLVFSNLTEEQALKYSSSLEDLGAKTKIDGVLSDGIEPERKKKVERVNKNYRIFQLSASTSVIVTLILFALPTISISLILYHFDCSIFSFIFSNSESYNGVLSSIMSDLIGLETLEYNNIFSIFTNINANNLILFVSVLAILLTTLVYGFIAIVEIIALVMNLFKEPQDKRSKIVVCDAYEEKLSNLTAEQLRLKSKTTTKLFCSFLIKKLIKTFLTVFFPIRLLLYLGKQPLVFVSPVFIVIFIIATVVHLTASILLWLYSVKYPIELNNVDYLKKTIK